MGSLAEIPSQEISSAQLVEVVCAGLNLASIEPATSELLAAAYEALNQLYLRAR